MGETMSRARKRCSAELAPEALRGCKVDLLQLSYQLPVLVLSRNAGAENPFHNALASRLTRITAAARTKKASADEGVAS